MYPLGALVGGRQQRRQTLIYALAEGFEALGERGLVAT